MKTLQNKQLYYLILALGVVGFLFYVVMLWVRPMESWTDDAFYTDWALRISQGGFITHIWENGKPGYCPLYPLILAGWIKLFGFSSFSVHILGVIVSLIVYYLIVFRLPHQSWTKDTWSIIFFSLCYWLSPNIMYIMNCGRHDFLCILWGILAIDAYIRAYENKDKLQLGLFCLWAALLMWTGLEGVIFLAIIVAIYSCFDIKQSLRKWYIYVLYAVSTIGAFVAEFFYLLHYHCGKTFIVSIIGHSTIASKIENFIQTGVWQSAPDAIQNDTSLSFIDKFLLKGSFGGIFGNKEFWMLLIGLSILLLIIVFTRRNKFQFNRFEKTLAVASYILPLVFILLIGRYAYYYTWGAYIPLIIFLTALTNQIPWRKYIYPLVVIGIAVCLYVHSPNSDFIRWDAKRVIDKQHMHEIEVADIQDNETVYIPYEWYYYIAERSENFYAYWSFRYPVTMKKMILSTDKELREWGQRLDLELIEQVGIYRIYKVTGEKIPGYLLPLSEFTYE